MRRSRTGQADRLWAFHRGGPTKLERPFIDGPAGALEALLEWDPEASPRLATLVCHPHPLYGGTMHNKVVFRAAKAALELGLPTLRFNFRSVGKSQGEFGEGIGEREDVSAALDYLQSRFPERPICLMGFSFGAGVGLAAGANDPRVESLIAIGLPTSDPRLSFDFTRTIAKPTLIVQGAQDEFARREDVEKLFTSLRGPKRLHFVEGANHFFTGKLEELQATVRAFLEEVVEAASSDSK